MHWNEPSVTRAAKHVGRHAQPDHAALYKAERLTVSPASARLGASAARAPPLPNPRRRAAGSSKGAQVCVRHVDHRRADKQAKPLVSMSDLGTNSSTRSFAVDGDQPSISLPRQSDRAELRPGREEG